MGGTGGIAGGYRQRPLESLERCGLRVDPYGAGQVAGAAARETYVRGSRVRACDRVRVWAFACVCALALAHNSILKLKVTSLSVCSRLASRDVALLATRETVSDRGRAASFRRCRQKLKRGGW